MAVPANTPKQDLDSRDEHPTSSHREVVIRNSGRWGGIRWQDLWEFRALLYFLVWRDIKVRYKQTVLGAAWAVLQPLLAAVIFTLLFNRVAGVASDGVPYTLFSYSALLLWTFFNQGVMLAANSIVGSANLISKVYFPRMLVPTASVLSGVVDLAVAFPVLVLMMAYFGIGPSWAVVFIPLFILLAVVSATGVGLWLAALNAEYRDVRYVVPFLLQVWLFSSPVIYPASLLYPKLEEVGLPGWVFGVNPMAGAVEGFRWCLFQTGPLPTALVITSSLSAAFLLASGALYFRYVERSFADVV
jgi:lipopolysaccharide transport system permease protein